MRAAALEPDSSPNKVWDEIRKHSGEAAILVAGHEPLFSATVAWMLGSTRAMVHFRKGALVRLDVESLGTTPAAVLEWMLIPKLA